MRNLVNFKNTWLMNKKIPKTKRYRKNFRKKVAESETNQYTSAQNPPLDNRNVPNHIKDMWEVYLGFMKLEL